MLTRIIGTSKKKRATKLAALLLSVTLLFAMPFSANAAQTTTSIYTKTKLTHNSRFDDSVLENGIDISVHNGEIDFAKVKKTDTKVIIVRVGCRGYGSKGTMIKDKNFETNISNSIKNGFDTGVYFYSQALNEEEAIEEAEFVLKYIKGYKINLPVYYDYEFATYSGRLDTAWREKKLNKSKMTKNALAFCETIEEAGYTAGVYASKSFFEDNLDRTQLEKKYAIWLAHYASKTAYAGDYQMWQYAGGDPDGSNGAGKVSGIDGYVDSNYVYYNELMSFSNNDFEIADIPNKAYTGKAVKPSLKVTVGEKELIKGEDYYVTFSDNIQIGKASVTVTGINDYENIKPRTKTFSIVPPKVTELKLDKRETNSLTVSWKENKHADKYHVQVHRSTGWVNAGTTDKTSLEISDLATASNYRVRVRAVKTVDKVKYYGSYSSEIETATAPSVPSSLSTSAVKPDSFKLSWKKQSNANYYNVYLYNSESDKYELFEKVEKGKNNYLVVENLTSNTGYKFKVSAHKTSKDGAELESKKSAAYTAYTSPAAPSITSAKSNAYKKITVKWKKAGGASGYQIMWSTTKNFSSNFKSVTSTGSSVTLSTAQTKKTYYVRVRAYKTRNGKKIYSPWSKTLSAKTK